MTCSVENCGQRAHVLGWCSKHHHRWKRHGDPLLQKHRSPGDGKVVVACPKCGIEFETYKAFKCKPNCASCRLPHEPQRLYDCQQCHKQFKGKQSREKDGRNKYCSQDCYWKSLESTSHFNGKTNPKWLGGITPQHRERYKGGWRALRRDVLLRDRERCRACSLSRKESYAKFGRDLIVHHIDRYLNQQDDSLENLATVCCSCHPKVEGRPELLIPIFGSDGTVKVGTIALL